MLGELRSFVISLPILTILGLAVFESITSVDNAIINAEVLATMHPRHGLVSDVGIAIAVFGVRGCFLADRLVMASG